MVGNLVEMGDRPEPKCRFDGSCVVASRFRQPRSTASARGYPRSGVGLVGFYALAVGHV